MYWHALIDEERLLNVHELANAIGKDHTGTITAPTLGSTAIWFCHTVRMQTAKYKRFHSSADCSTAIAG